MFQGVEISTMAPIENLTMEKKKIKSRKNVNVK